MAGLPAAALGLLFLLTVGRAQDQRAARLRSYLPGMMAGAWDATSPRGWGASNSSVERMHGPLAQTALRVRGTLSLSVAPTPGAPGENCPRPISTPATRTDHPRSRS